MSGLIQDLRDETYLRILTKKTALQYLFNDFGVEKTSYPKKTLEDLIANYPSGLLYVVSGVPGDWVNLSRPPYNLVKGQYAVKLAYQMGNVNPDDTALVDTLYEFIEQIADTCRKDVDPELFAFASLEWLKDANEVPYHFVLFEQRVFEAHFTAYYNRPLP